MSPALPKPWSVDDFLAWEAQQEDRYEFVDGIVFMMTGGTGAHAAIRDNIVASLREQLRGSRCRAIGTGPKVLAGAAGLYPDVIATCAPIDLAADHIVNPTVIVEVLSRSTADRDRGIKWLAYQRLATLEHYVLVSQDQRRVDLFSRSAGKWIYEIFEPPIHRVDLPSIEANLSFDEI